MSQASQQSSQDEGELRLPATLRGLNRTPAVPPARQGVRLLASGTPPSGGLFTSTSSQIAAPPAHDLFVQHHARKRPLFVSSAKVPSTTTSGSRPAPVAPKRFRPVATWQPHSMGTARPSTSRAPLPTPTEGAPCPRAHSAGSAAQAQASSSAAADRQAEEHSPLNRPPQQSACRTVVAAAAAVDDFFAVTVDSVAVTARSDERLQFEQCPLTSSTQPIQPPLCTTGQGLPADLNPAGLTPTGVLRSVPTASLADPPAESQVLQRGTRVPEFILTQPAATGLLNLPPVQYGPLGAVPSPGSHEPEKSPSPTPSSPASSVSPHTDEPHLEMMQNAYTDLADETQNSSESLWMPPPYDNDYENQENVIPSSQNVCNDESSGQPCPPLNVLTSSQSSSDCEVIQSSQSPVRTVPPVNVGTGLYNSLNTPTRRPSNEETVDYLKRFYFTGVDADNDSGQPGSPSASVVLNESDANAARGVLYEATIAGKKFQRIIPKSAILKGFVPATSTNLPEIDMVMHGEFLGLVSKHWTAELKYFKWNRNMRKAFCFNAVGSVQLKETKDSQGRPYKVVFMKVTPETSVRATPYDVEIECNFDEVNFVRCYGCTARLGFCKHALAALAWLHYKTMEPSPTSILCYWKKSAMSTMDLLLHPSKMTPSELGVELKSQYLGGSGMFLAEVKQSLLVDVKVPSALRSQFTNTLHPLCMHNLFHCYCTSQESYKSFENFKQFVAKAVKSTDKTILKDTENETKKQSVSWLWKILRYGRITGSRLPAINGCKKETSEVREMNKIFGADKLKSTEAMARGLRIEEEVRKVVAKDLNRRIQLGHFAMSEELPLFGASPDGVGTDFILEIKSPSKNKNISTYLKTDGKPTKRVLLQMLLQMRLLKMKIGYLIIPDQDFEKNKKYKLVKVLFDENSEEKEQVELKNLFYDAISKAEDFYKKHVFSNVLKRMRPILI